MEKVFFTESWPNPTLTGLADARLFVYHLFSCCLKDKPHHTDVNAVVRSQINDAKPSLWRLLHTSKLKPSCHCHTAAHWSLVSNLSSMGAHTHINSNLSDWIEVHLHDSVSSYSLLQILIVDIIYFFYNVWLFFIFIFNNYYIIYYDLIYY
jgi:hypothetical protein